MGGSSVNISDNTWCYTAAICRIITDHVLLTLGEVRYVAMEPGMQFIVKCRTVEVTIWVVA